MNDPNKLKQEELDAYLEIINSPAYWAEAVLINPESREPLTLNFVQRRILSSKFRKLAIRVHRRAGKSFLLAIYALWYCVTHPGRKVLIICPDQRKVQVLFNTIFDFINASPGLKDAVTNSTKNPAWIKFTNDAQISGFTTGSRSSGKGDSIRGQGADVVIIDEAAFLNDDDWMAITPIMIGDRERKGKVVCFISSTPTQDRGVYYHYCTKDFSSLPEGARWDQIHIPITANEDWTEEEIADVKATEREAAWEQEWLAEFPDVGEGVFKPSYVDRAGRAFDYLDPYRPETIPKGKIRTMGVDWDKYQATPNIVVMEMDEDAQLYRICYREEIEKSEFSLTVATNRVIELNSIFNPSWIYVDRGYGEQAVELLHLHGLQNPASKLDTKVVGISFSQNVEVVDPASGEVNKKRIKPFMVNILVGWFEKNQFAYPATDTFFKEQLLGFKVLKVTDNTVKYSSDNEHIIDASCLAALAIHEHFANPFTFESAIDSYVMPVPEVVTNDDVLEDLSGVRQVYGPVMEPGFTKGNFTRRNLPDPKKGLTYSGGFTTGVIRKSF